MNSLKFQHPQPNWVAAATEQLGAMIAMRRDLHAHPELAFKEHRTALQIEAALEGLGVPSSRLAGTGVIGLIRGGRPGPVIGLRADMDALPLSDTKSVPYRSVVPGVGHLCGHDAHVAMLVGVAGMLAGRRDDLAGTVKLVFEPAEEVMGVDADSGAELLIEAGVLEDPDVTAMLGCHVYPDYVSGTVATRAGTIMSGMDTFRLLIKGKESHTAQSHEGRDAIVGAAAVVTALQSLISREHPTSGVGSLNIGRIEGGKAINLLAEQVVLEGSVRTSDEAWRDGLAERFNRIVAGVLAAYGCDYELDYDARHIPATINDTGTSEAVMLAAATVVDLTMIERMAEPRLAAETFWHYANRVPSCFWLLGVAKRGADVAPSHHSMFDIDESALATGAAVTAAATWTLLHELA